MPIRHDDADFGPVGVEFVGENSGQRGRSALAELGRSIEWRGKGADEIGVDTQSGKTVVRIDTG